ncbi:hypothetical protein [Tatumella terrea]|uniref:Transposase n=1 Tax=Tatumella terrea TaxID=419007 RepID=A0ABW1W0N2_9GAMM
MDGHGITASTAWLTEMGIIRRRGQRQPDTRVKYDRMLTDKKTAPQGLF